MKRMNMFTRLAGAGLFAVMAALAVAPAVHAEPEPGAKRRRSGFDLLGAGSTWTAVTNRVQCGLNNLGEVCVDTFGSPTGGGGFWPAGSPNQYIFNSGLQIAGIIPQDAPIWAGDTVGAYIFDARGTQQQGQAVSLVYSSVNSDDLDNWPAGAYIRDASIYNQALLGRKSISQEDTWVRYWDGPGLLSGRRHPMGILVEQRGLAWNFPSGNQDIVYFLYTFYNISATDPAAYANLDPAIRQEIIDIATDWVTQTESRVGVDIPSQGYRIDSVFAAFAMDPDVGDAGSNSSTAILPFSMGLAYKNDFNEPTWLFPPDINGPPFGPYPGFVGVKYLKSPIDPVTLEQVGLTMFSNTTNPSAANSLFPDPVGVSQLWRYLSGRIDVTQNDPANCVANPIQRRICALVQAPTDTRFYQASGPFSLNPGESSTIVVAYVHAAPIGAVVAPYYDGNLAPGIPPSGAEIVADPSLLRPIELAAGWAGHRDADGNGAIEQDEVNTIPRSLLQKSLVAQSLFDAQFLLPFAPEAPDFFLVPGNNAVTVVWKPSVTEQIGDPYFDIASDPDPSNGLYDANYRFNDVEGYRIYRGRTRAQMEMIAQFDYAGTTFVDYTGVWAYDGKCAPELGITADCPSFPSAHDLVGDISQVPPGGRVELAGGQFIEIPSEQLGVGDGTASPPLANLLNTPVAPSSVTLKVTLAPGDSLVAHDDGLGALTGDATGTINYLTGAITATWVQTVDQPIVAAYGYTNALGDGEVLITEKINPIALAGFPELSNTGVPFAYEDNAVVNSVQYFYAVTAFDVNSVASGPGSLESPLATKSVTPRAPSGQVVAGVLQSMDLIGADGTVLDRSAPLPTIDPATGKFSGPMPPTDGWTFALSAFLPDVLGDDQADLRIDSVVPGDAFGGTYGDIKYYMTATGSAGTFAVELPGFHNTFSSGLTSSAATFLLVAFDNDKAGLFGGDGSYELSAGTEVSVEGAYRLGSWGRGDINGDPGGGITVHAGPRWFAGANETQDDPQGGFASPSNSNAGSSQAWTDLSHTAGELPGVDLLWRPASYSTVNFEFRNVESITSTVYRAADIEVVWGPNGTLASVTDVTHQVPVPFHEGIRASWGFLTAESFATVVASSTNDKNNGLLTWADVACLPEIARSPNRTMCTRTATPAHFVNTATLSPISDGTSSFSGASGLTPSGDGFIFYLNGHFFLMRMTALPAAGTTWTARFFSGWIRGTPGADDYEFGSTTRPPAVPGLTARLTYSGTSVDPVATDAMLANVHTVPDPYYVTNGLEVTPSQKILKFVNLPTQAIIRIYSLSGVLVDVVEHNDPAGGGETTWQVRNRNQQFVASGVYFYHIETPSGATKVGRFTVINSKGIAVGQTNQ